MVTSYELVGILRVKGEVEQISDKFKKLDFVIEEPNEKDEKWNQFIKFQITQDKCDLMDKYNVGDELKVHFNLRGRAWINKEGVTNYFGNNEAWRIESVSVATIAPSNVAGAPVGDDDELPF